MCGEVANWREIDAQGGDCFVRGTQTGGLGIQLDDDARNTYYINVLRHRGSSLWQAVPILDSVRQNT